MRLLAIAALTLSSLSSQQYPDGAALVRLSESALRKLHSFEFHDRSTTETLLEGLTFTDRTEIPGAILNPGKARVELKSEDTDTLAISNGEFTWMYSSDWHEYTRKSAASSFDGVMAAMGVEDMMPHFGDVPITAKTIGEDSVAIEGHKYDCWVVEMHIDPMELPGPGKGKTSNGVMTHWFDKQLGIDLQSTFFMKVQTAIGAPSFEMRGKTVRKSMQIDGPIADAQFVFPSPADARQVEKLSMFGGQRDATPDLVGKAAPDFTVSSPEGKAYTLAALKGKPVLLGPCCSVSGPPGAGRAARARSRLSGSMRNSRIEA